MAELFQAYGGLNENSYVPTNNYQEGEQDQYDEPVKQVYQQPVAKKQIQQVPIVQPAPAVVQQIQNKPDYSNQMNGFVPVVNKQPEPSKNLSYSYSFTDRMILKRPEVIKLAVFSLVIVLAISLEKIATHYITKYLSENIFTDFQEFMIRLVYPITVFLIIWVIKSM